MLRNACLLVVVVACSKPVAFKGETALQINGKPPAPPVAVEPPRVELRDNKIVIREKIQFAFDKATILPASFGLLDEVAKVITSNPHIKKIQVEGHASSEGDPTHNAKLSDDRARSVVTYLTQHGIAKDLLVAKGFGIDRPIADNSTDAGREQNRRVEFNIVDQDVTVKRVEIDKSGKEKVIEEKHTGATSSR